ncbi:hypothetical protein MTO96_004498 [Rhipicephalus appendiculatus]
MPLAQRLGKDFLLCGDVNAHHTAWGSHRCCPRGQALWDVSNQLGLSILNTGTPTFMRRAARVVLSAIDVSLAAEGCHYTWTPLPDTWGVGPPAPSAEPDQRQDRQKQGVPHG